MSGKTYRPVQVLAALFLWLPVMARAEEPLHQRIDRLLSEERSAPLSTDAEFLRRITLDLTGTIPRASEAQAFLGDCSPDKRSRLIDALLASPEYARHLATFLDVMLMERRPDKHVPRADWLEFLRASVQANKTWDELVREILSADGSDSKTRPAARFYLDREGEPHLLTRDIGRLLLGVNLQCAQCHDHPLIEDYKQDHYYGLFAFFNRSFLFVDKQNKQLTVFAEKAEGDVSYQSVFNAKVTKSTGPRLLHGPALPEPMVEKGKEYEIAPAKDIRPVPRYSRRAQLAQRLTSTANPSFHRNMANRLWAMLLGRGLVHPLDLEHSANPPSHPELLSGLTAEFAASRGNMRSFLRQVALSNAYQRSCALPAGVTEVAEDSFAVGRLKPLSPEQLARALMQATGLTDVERRSLGAKADESRLEAKLTGNLVPFVAAFGGPVGQSESQSFQATLDQALFLANGSLVRSWLVPLDGNLTDRLNRLKDPGAVAEELYVSILTRPPSAEERAEVADYLKVSSQDRGAALQELAWAMLAAAEFRFNH